MTDSRAIPPARVLLVGMMGSGKSTIGRELSRRTGWPFVDNDELLERATGRTARELLAAEGAEAMRDAESAALRAGVAVPPPAVVATAAGTVLAARDRDVIRDGGFAVWLRAPAEVLAERTRGSEHRPWLEDDPVGWFHDALAQREPLYAEVTDLAIDTDTTEPDEAAERIVDTLSARR